ncbi:MAG: FtsX-like permease family protein [Acidimicrobiales bacterium]|jgi:putative ABC transport system permease protein
MTIETKNDDPSLAELRNYATAAGILLAFGVLAMTVGLIRSETAGDVRILTAVGANRRTRRTLTGATACALAMLGAVLGTAAAYLDAAAFFGSQINERMSQVPVLDLFLVLVALPAVAASGGWLFAGREPPALSRHPLE